MTSGKTEKNKFIIYVVLYYKLLELEMENKIYSSCSVFVGVSSTEGSISGTSLSQAHNPQQQLIFLQRDN